MSETIPSGLNGPRVAAKSGPARSLVIFLHGYGSNGADLISLSDYWSELLPDTAFVSPNAPQMVPGMGDAYQWWSITSLEPGQRRAGAAQAAPILQAFIDEELLKLGIDESRLALVGFSQGTMMSLQAAATRARPFAGVVGFSGMVADAEVIAGARSKPPVLLIHGDADPMIPIAAFHQARSTLASAGFTVAGHVSPGLVHSIDATGLYLAGGFLARSLAG